MYVRAVALCQGRGADPLSYKPQRDESQWWNRRDALVRCTAAFLCGPMARMHNIPSNLHRDLCLVYEDDYACMEMKVLEASKAERQSPPSETNVVALWKSAAGSVSSWVNDENVGLTCRLRASSVRPEEPDAGHSLSSDSSKRHVLTHLQKHCSLEFLRRHNLNSKPDAVLRKANKKALLNVWREWNVRSAHTNARESAHARREQQTNQLKRWFQDLLQPASSRIAKVVAVLLHESALSELPCFESRVDLLSRVHVDGLQVCLFLGAVRDMHPWENRLLKSCCEQTNVPLVRMRLGPVAEFTSKILSVIAYHHAQDMLGPSLLRLVQGSASQRNNKADHVEDSMLQPGDYAAQAKLHTLCFVPFSSSTLSSELLHRTRAMWCLVRVTVCALWRSRVASTQWCPLENTLSLLFDDGPLLTLQQEELTASLAQQHQAAPSEYQVLQALCRKRDQCAMTDHNVQSHADREKRIESLLLHELSADTWWALDTTTSGTNDQLCRRIYSGLTPHLPERMRRNVLALVRIQVESSHSDDSFVRSHKATRNVLKEMRIPVLCQALIQTQAQDAEAVTVTMLQHFSYQNRLVPALEYCYRSISSDVSEDRKRSKEDSKRKKKKRKKHSAS